MQKIRVRISVLILVQLVLGAHALCASDWQQVDKGKKVRRSIAQEDPKVSTQVKTREYPVYDEQSGTGLGLFAGADYGALSVYPLQSGIEPQKSGTSTSGRAYLSFYNQWLFIDAGGGWVMSQIQGLGAYSLSKTRTITNQFVQTKSGLIEVSPRLRLGSYFNIGPQASALLGSQSNFGIEDTAAYNPVFLGLKGGANFEIKDIHVRIVAQAGWSLTLPGRQAVTYAGGLEIGIPFLRGKTKIKETETEITKESIQKETIETESQVEVPVEVVKEVVKERVQFTFDDQIVHFEFDSDQLRPHSVEYLKKAGRYLASESDLWSRAKIVGHTDDRGEIQYNQDLSDRRAARVKEILTSEGVSPDKIEVEGLGKTSPIDDQDSELARARNRRVEVYFSEVSDPKKFRDALTKIKFATLSPSTCQNGKCR